MRGFETKKRDAVYLRVHSQVVLCAVVIMSIRYSAYFGEDYVDIHGYFSACVILIARGRGCIGLLVFPMYGDAFWLALRYVVYSTCFVL